MLFADVPGAEQAVRSSIESLRWLFAVVLALAIGEAFKQFVSDKAEKLQDSHIHWDRIWALAAFVALHLMSFAGFQANVVPTEKVKDSIVLLMSLMPAIFGICSMAIFLFYPLTDKRVNEINEELKERRLKAGTPSEA